MADYALELRGVNSGYGNLPILWDIDLRVEESVTMVVLGANGAGKSTLLKTIVGILPATSGTIFVAGRPVEHLRVDQRIGLEMSYMSEQGIFPSLTIEENLQLGCYLVDKSTMAGRIDEVYTYFPELKERRRTIAGSLSGGQRKMVGVAKALVSDPRLLIMDEPSSGLSPFFVKELVARLKEIKDQHRTLLVAEQNVSFLEIADSACVIEGGRIQFTGSVQEFEADEQLRNAFFGLVE